MFTEYLARVVDGGDLTDSEAHDAMGIIMSGGATEAQIAGFLVALRIKGETVPEIVGCARAMREAATKIDVGDMDVVDTCGTGGDRTGTFNVSTAAALVTAAAGVPVAKHGNRSVSSGSGSADVLRELGVNIEAPVGVVERCIREVGIGFLFAPLLHKAMKYAIGPRRELGLRTVFNILGPLTNPAGARRQVLGVFNDELVEVIAGVLQGLDAARAMVVHSADGMDEISVCAETRIAQVNDGIECRTVTPEELGVGRHPIEDLLVAGPAQSADVIRRVLAGEQGAPRDIVLVNAGAAIYIGGKARSHAEGVEKAAGAIDCGAGTETLARLIEVSNATP
jgi:anthranilate phosphoribosyltransferase